MYPNQIAQSSNASKETSTKRIAAIKEQRSLLLAEIGRLDNKPTEKSYIPDRIHEIQQGYNDLVDEELALTPGPLPDPFTVLPPELWPDIIPDYPTDVIRATLVSHKWRENISSIPSLWTTIILNEVDSDCLAKAMISMHLSRPLKIHVAINTSYEAWKPFAPMILGEAYRIKGLRVAIMNFEEAVTVVTAFDSLPVLRYIDFPSSNRYDVFHWWDNPRRYMAPMDPILLQRLCSKINLDPTWVTPQLFVEGEFIKPKMVTIDRLDKQTVEVLNRFNNLKYLRIFERHSDRETSTQKATNSPSPSITTLSYCGLNVTRALQYTGNMLTHLNTQINICNIPSLLDSLVHFPVLDRIALQINQEIQKATEYNETRNNSFCSIRYLELAFSARPFFWASDTTTTEELLEVIDNHEDVLTLVFDLLAERVPAVEKADLSGEFRVDPAIRYIRTLRNLKSLSLGLSTPNIKKIHCVTPEFERLASHPYQISAISGDWIQHQHLQRLSIPSPVFSDPSSTQTNSDSSQIRYSVSSIPILSVTNLDLLIRRGQPWFFDFGCFPNLTTINFNRYVSELAFMCIGDFLEELILQPRRWPSLESLNLGSNLVEWDLVILMLERRNIVSRGAVKAITSLDHPRGMPYMSYRLSYPILQLFQGKFPEREPLFEYSIDAVGKRLWDRNAHGCHNCIRRFKTCGALPKDTPRPEWFPVVADLAHRHELPFESLRADPPLSVSQLEWLKGKHERRQTYMNLQLEGAKMFSRPFACK